MILGNPNSSPAVPVFSFLFQLYLALSHSWASLRSPGPWPFSSLDPGDRRLIHIPKQQGLYPIITNHALSCFAKPNVLNRTLCC